MICDRCDHSWETHEKSRRDMFTKGADGKLKVKAGPLTACTAKTCPCDGYFPRKDGQER
nr:hypothetical protein [Actinomycetota bacterium]